MKQEYATTECKDLLKTARLDLLDCEVVGIYVRRNELTGQFDATENPPYEIVISVPASMGERWVRKSGYYNSLPTAESLYNEVLEELKDYVEGGNESFERLQVEAIRKALRTAPKKWAEIKGGV